MKKISIIIAVLISIGSFAQVEKYIPDPPSPPRLVNDFTNPPLLTNEQTDHLEKKLVNYDDSTSSQILIAIVDNLHDYAAVDYAVALGRKWGVGGKQFNNGVVILISTGGGEGRRDAFIATGYGLEGAIPDITANTILNAELIPNLKAGQYYTALDRTTTALIQAAAGEYKAPPKKEKGTGVAKVIIAIVVLFFILSAFGGGHRGGGYMSRRGYRGFWGPTIFPTGGWGGSGGGWSGGGGGGFGGFGGGSFGGGGAGGSW